MGLNKIFIMGNICKDIELKQVGETHLIQNTVAVARKFTDKNGERQTDFINIKIWGKQAEFFSKYFKKGDKTVLVGRLETGSYEKEDGTKVYTTDVVVEEIDFCGNKSENTLNNTKTEEASFITIDDTSELPF